MITFEKNGLQKKVSTGYSWKALLFGFLYPVARGDIRGAFRHFAYSCFTCGLSLFVVPFLYNKKYIKTLIEDGWKPDNEKSDFYLFQKLNYRGGLSRFERI